LGNAIDPFYVNHEDSDFYITCPDNGLLRLQTAGEAEVKQEKDEYGSNFVH